MRPSSEKKWRSRGWCAAVALLTTLVIHNETLLPLRLAVAFQASSARGNPATTARIFSPQFASGAGGPPAIGSVSATSASPGTHTSAHISHDAAAFNSTLSPALR